MLKFGVLLLPLGLVCAGAGVAQAATPPVWTAWINSLRAQGYTVTQGVSVAFTIQRCQQTAFTVFKTCFNTDASDLYVQPQVPLGGSYFDPYYAPATTMTLPNGTVVGSTWQLDTTEAMVTVTNLPPTGAYFSVQSYMFTRPVADYPAGVQHVSPDPARGVIFGSFSNSIDNVIIARQSGLGFGQGTIGTITTANADLTQRLTASFASVGGDTTQLFAETVGPNVTPGLGASADDFTTVIRYLAPQTRAGVTWRDQAARNVVVYRISQPAGLSVTRYGAPTINDKMLNANEASHAANLSELAQLLQGWLAGQEDKTVTISPTKPGETLNSAGQPLAGEFGPACISGGHDCAGDSQDTDAYKFAVAGKLPANEAIIMTGVDHTVTNNTTYLGVGAEDAVTGTGEIEPYQVNASAAGFGYGTITNSAEAALVDLGLYGAASPSLKADLPNLYVQFFARPCDASVAYCNKSYTSVVTTDLIPLTDGISMWERAYVLPGYPNGANPDMLGNPYVIH
jgi:hypothetical protein